MIRRFSPALLFLLLGLAIAPSVARADDCPDNIPAASRERRALAKDWFSRAEAADAANDPIGAVKAYQCSLKMVPHAFTAFNLGRLAERTGDLELAVDAFGTYVKLAPESPDRPQIEAKIAALGERIQALRAEQTAAATSPSTAPPKPTPPISEPPLDLKPAPPAESNVIEKAPTAPPSSFSLAKAAPWIIGGVGVVALAAGVALNVSARGKMSDCFELAQDQQQLSAAQSACDDAKPRAYASYALFGIGAAAAVADGVLLFLTKEHSERALAASPLPGGALLSGRFRF